MSDTWSLGYEAEGSEDAAWVIRPGFNGVIYADCVTADIDPDDVGAAQKWATETLAKPHYGVTVAAWRPHRPGPGIDPDYWDAIEDDDA